MNIDQAIIIAIREAQMAELDISLTVKDFGQPTESLSFNAYGAPATLEPLAAVSHNYSAGVCVGELRPAEEFPAARAVALPKFVLGEKVYLPGRVVTVSHHDEGRPTFTLEMEDRHGNQVLVVVDEADPLKEAEPRLASDAQ